MIIKLLLDNTVSVLYKNGAKETINSTHSDKALSKLSKIIADLFPYKGAMEFDSREACLNYNSESALVNIGDKNINPDDDITNETVETQTFCNAVWDNGGRTVWERKQSLLELETELNELQSGGP